MVTRKTPCLYPVISWMSPEGREVFKQLVQMDAFLKLTSWWISLASGSFQRWARQSSNLLSPSQPSGFMTNEETNGPVSVEWDEGGGQLEGNCKMLSPEGPVMLSPHILGSVCRPCHVHSSWTFAHIRACPGGGEHVVYVCATNTQPLEQAHTWPWLGHLLCELMQIITHPEFEVPHLFTEKIRPASFGHEVICKSMLYTTWNILGAQ